MESSSTSLLELDVFASEESLRVYMYKRALPFRGKSKQFLTLDSVASAFLDFVGGERWRLEALDTVLQRSSMRTTVEVVLEGAQEIADWVKPKPPPPPPPSGEGTLDDVTSPTTKKKVEAKKK
jgi:hypothetical protein